MGRGVILGLMLVAVAGSAVAGSTAEPTPVNINTFIRAESDRYFAKNAAEAGGYDKNLAA